MTELNKSSQPNDSNAPLRDAGLSRLYRSAADEVPPAALDAAILQAARDAVAPPAARVVPWWKRLLVPAGVAATMLFAVMLTLTMERHSPDSVEVSSQKAEPAPAAAAPLSPAQPAVSKGRADQAATARETTPAAMPSAAAPTEKKMKAAPLVRDVDLPQAMPVAPAPATAPVSSADRLAEPATKSESRSSSDGLAAERAPAAAAAPAHEFAAKRATPRAELAWLEEIRQLRQQGRLEEAARRVAEFRRAYPDYPLPEDLK